MAAWSEPPTEAQQDAVTRLADKPWQGVLARTGPDGTVEVVRVHKGEFRRYVVHENGALTLIESRPPNWQHRWSVHLMGWGLLMFCSVILYGVLTQPDTGALPGWAGVLAFLGIGMSFVGSAIRDAPRLHTDDPDEWTPVGVNYD